MNWTPSDGSRERLESTTSASSWDTAHAPLAERADRRRQNGLQGINDLDFEALIEILGTNGQDKAQDPKVENILLHAEERSAEDDSSTTRSAQATAERTSPRRNLEQDNPLEQ